MNYQDHLEEKADELFKYLQGWEQFSLELIGKRIKETQSLSIADVKILQNIANIEKIVNSDLDRILKEFAKVSELTIKETQKIYEEVAQIQSEQASKLGFELDQTYVENLIHTYAKDTATNIFNLTGTTAQNVGFLNATNQFISIDKAIRETLDLATFRTATGQSSFNENLQNAIQSLGGNGMRIQYPSGITRRVDSVARQTMLYGAKQLHQAYDDKISKDLKFDGFEIDYHPYARPTHEFMGGVIFAYGGKEVTVNGITYPSGDEALIRLMDYGCLHFRTGVLLGVSEPSIDKETLAKFKARDKELVQIGDVKKTRYEWKQKMRRLEVGVRNQWGEYDIYKASGFKEGQIKAKQKIEAYTKAHKQIADKTGLPVHGERFIARKNKAVVDKSLKSGGNSIKVNQAKAISYKKNPNDFSVNRKLVNTKKYRSKFNDISDNKDVNQSLYSNAVKMLEHRDGTDFEDLVLIDCKNGKIIAENLSSNISGRTGLSFEEMEKYEKNKNPVISLHNHPNSSRPSYADIKTAFVNYKITAGVVVCHDGSVHIIKSFNREIDIDKMYENAYNNYMNKYNKTIAEIKSLDYLYEKEVFKHEIR